MKAKRDRLNELKELLRLVDLYRDTKPVYDELQGIKWKGKREKFEREHENELRTFHMAAGSWTSTVPLLVKSPFMRGNRNRRGFTRSTQPSMSSTSLSKTICGGFNR